MASKCDTELRLLQERVKYVVVGNPEAVVGINTSTHRLLRHCARVAPKDHPRVAPEKPLQTFSDFEFEPFMTPAEIKKIDLDFK